MPMIEVNVNEAHELEVVEPNQEYKLRIVDVRVGTDKNDDDYFMPRFEVVDRPYAKDFSYYVKKPKKETMNPRDFNNALLTVKHLCEAFGFDSSRPFDPEDSLPGLEGWAILGKKDSDEYGEQNVIKKFIVRR